MNLVFFILTVTFRWSFGFLLDDTTRSQNQTTTGSTLVPATLAVANIASTLPTSVCQDTIDQCSFYGRTACTNKVYEAWAKSHCAMYCGFCTPPVALTKLCENKVPNCAEFDSGDLCTTDSYYSWAYENCKGYCKFDICNDSLCEDNEHTNCQLLHSQINICSDIGKAKTICKKYCNLCNVTDGKWCSWEAWSTCSVTCASGTQVRSRQCACPAQANGGTDCSGDAHNSKTCLLKTCPVHGGWSRWSSWGSCSATCGIGLERRDRSCSNPYPGPGGDSCFGDARDDRACFMKACADGGWSIWSSWGACTTSCLGGISQRTRKCNNPVPSTFGHDCIGNNKESKSCNTVQCPVNGRWSSWTSWSSCSVTCGVGLKTRTRRCNNPTPSNLGQACIGNSENKKICSMNNCPFAVRLVNGPHSYEGRLEVYHSGHWGTVCDDGFNDDAAKVVCRMLNFPGDVNLAQKYSSAPYGKGTLPIMLDDVSCTGSELSIFDCSHRAWGSNNCAHGEDVGVVCHTCMLVRLTGSSSGRVEVSLDGSHWGTVCNDDFNDNAAKVVCRMLGLPLTNPSAYTAGHGSGTIYLDNVICSGAETSLLYCSHNHWRDENCDHDEDIGVRCPS